MIFSSTSWYFTLSRKEAMALKNQCGFLCRIISLQGTMKEMQKGYVALLKSTSLRGFLSVLKLFWKIVWNIEKVTI